MNKCCIKLYKSGKFYNAYSDDGIILHHLFGYKYTEYKRSVGFPEVAFNKVIAKLEMEKISYIVYDKDSVLSEFKGIDKNYKLVLKDSLKNYDLEKRLDRIREKLDGLTTDELEKIISSLESK